MLDRGIDAARWVGDNPARWQQRLGAASAADAQGLLVAAVRETFEEVGVLLAEREDGTPITDEDLRTASFREARRRLSATEPKKRMLRPSICTPASPSWPFKASTRRWNTCSQRAEGWVLVADRYDDGGFSGGTLDRPAMQRLLADVERGAIDVIVVYKIDRLSRSLMDFARLVEVFDRHSVTFVSITQAFSTTTSMGRLTLNVLLSFAQFEREVIGERIRDKFAASRRKGIWMGGWAPLGYEVRDRKLGINDAEAKTVRTIFKRFATLGSATQVAKELSAKNVRNRRGGVIDKGSIYKLLNNRVYVGDAMHKGEAFPGEHEAIIDRGLWDQVHGILQQAPKTRAATNRTNSPALLKGLIFDVNGTAMSPTHTRRRGKLYRYYTNQKLIKGTEAADTSMRIPAGEIEELVIGQMRQVLTSPEIIVATWKQLTEQTPSYKEADVRSALVSFQELWSELFPLEQRRIASLLIDRVTVAPASVDVRLLVRGVSSLVTELTNPH
jgi:DNA invertase Pin-like site-specific DNA recombinase